MNIKKDEAHKVADKFYMVQRGKKELIYNFYYNNIWVLSTAIPKGRGDMHCTDKFRGQLHLTEEQLRLAIRCPFKYEHQVENLKKRGLIKE